MKRAHAAVAAIIAAVVLSATASAQFTEAPPMKLVLAGKTFTPPIKGQAEVGFLRPVTKRVKDMVITTIQVKNLAKGPIPRLTIDETWYDKSGAVVTGGKGVIQGLLPVGEVQTVTIETPYNSKMNANNWNFSHANGTIKTTSMKSFEEPAAAAPDPKAGAKPTARR